MQLLYAMDRDPEITEAEIESEYRSKVYQSYELLLFVLYVLEHICKSSLKDAEKRKSKHLPSEEDKRFDPCLYKNQIIQSLADNEAFRQFAKKHQFAQKINGDVLHEIYKKFAGREEYKNYLATAEEERDHLEILLSLFREVKKDELFTDLVEDHYPNWRDDQSLVIGAVKKIIKRLPEEGSFFVDYYPDDDTVENLGLKLLKKTIEQDDKLVERIDPVVNNWDVDRLAVIDLILLKLAVSELIHFSTIPKKVTLNEFVEIAKLYSTPKSKDFINGILDKLMKELDKEGKIDKKGRGLLDQ